MITVTTGSGADLESIMPVMESAFPPDFGEAWSLTQCTGALALSGTSLLVVSDGAQSDRRPCGFAIVRTVLDEAELLLIAVDVRYQRRGVGAKLLAHICAMVRAKGVHSLHVEVRHDNSALSFYNCHDFKKVGERANYYHRTDG
ncbi:MAG: hypothetical protein RL367_565, partial [Pseudomonadota bacterium]